MITTISGLIPSTTENHWQPPAGRLSYRQTLRPAGPPTNHRQRSPITEAQPARLRERAVKIYLPARVSWGADQKGKYSSCDRRRHGEQVSYFRFELVCEFTPFAHFSYPFISRDTPKTTVRIHRTTSHCAVFVQSVLFNFLKKVRGYEHKR